MAAFGAIQELIWLKGVLGEIGIPRNWNKNIVNHIKSLGFKQCVADNCLFVGRVDGNIYLISLYVDDILTWTRLNESSDSSLNTIR